MANIVRWFWGRVPSIDTTCWLGEDFGEGNFFARGVFWGEVVEVCPDEAAVKRCCYVIWMAFYFVVS